MESKSGQKRPRRGAPSPSPGRRPANLVLGPGLATKELSRLLAVDRPYSPLRQELYSPAELMAGFNPRALDSSLDDRIYLHAQRHGRNRGRRPKLAEALAQRVHDFSIDEALERLLDRGPDGLARAKKLVGVMGGHEARRGSPWYRRTAQTGRLLARAGYHVVSGGGPGLMEAANLGAYLAQETEAALTAAIDRLELAADFDRTDIATTARYVAAAREILARHPDGAENLAVPTWFYGHEPTNLFATRIAKYFSNSLREDGLLALASYGVVFAPGSAATRQEIFQNAAQNHYALSQWCSPMVFLGREVYGPRSGLYSVVRAAANANYRELLCLTDDPRAVVEFLEAHPPQRHR